MTTPIDKVLDEGNCGEATDRGEEAGAKAARLRTETSYKAGPVVLLLTIRQTSNLNVHP